MDPDFEKPLVDVEKRISELSKLNEQNDVSFDGEIKELRKKLRSLEKKVYGKLTPWQNVQVARHSERPILQDYIKALFTEFIELHGDRAFGDDKALVGGFATLNNQKVMLLGMEKGKTVEEKIEHNFGMSSPEGYRKALRLMKLAEKFGLPVLCLVDTPAAYPGKEAEERGQAEAIARNLAEMITLETHILILVTGEGGSGGALGIAVGDRVMMLSNSIYSVIPPEGCAAILWRDAEKAPEAAEALKLTANELLKLGIIDEIIPEPTGGAHRDYAATMAAVKESVSKHLTALKRTSMRKLLDKRYEKYTKIGRYKTSSRRRR